MKTSLWRFPALVSVVLLTALSPALPDHQELSFRSLQPSRQSCFTQPSSRRLLHSHSIILIENMVRLHIRILRTFDTSHS